MEIHPEAVFYVRLLGDPEVRNRIRAGSLNECQRLIDLMEEYIPHAELPAHYDWLIGVRDNLRKQEDA